MNQSANYMPEDHKNMDWLISKHYDYLRESAVQVSETERQIIGNLRKNFISAGKTFRPPKIQNGTDLTTGNEILQLISR
jgi:hypothetical protein